MGKLFVNLYPESEPPPATLTVQHKNKLYYARVIHAEMDHYNAPLTRRPPPFLHDHYHIISVTNGEGKFLIDGILHSVQPGQLFLTSPLQAHQFLNASHENIHYSEVTFKFATIHGKPLDLPFHEFFYEWTNYPCSPFIKTILAPATHLLLESKIDALVSCHSSSAHANNLELNYRLFDILHFIFTHAFLGLRAEVSLPLDEIKDYIHSHYQEPLNLNSLSRRAHLTPNYLSRRFKQLYGRTPIDYLIDLRVRSAAELLKTVNDTLEKIAADVGFDDPYSFSRLFKKRWGESPNSFRKRFIHERS